MTPASEDDEFFAAEYVLGTLDHAERQAAALRLERDPAFGGLVEAWTARLGPLSEGSPAMPPTEDLWPKLVQRLGWSAAVPTSNVAAVVVAFERRLRRWQLTAGLATALAAGLAVLTVITAFERTPVPQQALVAFLQATDAPPAYLIKADLGDRRLTVRPVSALPPTGKVYELWIIDPSLGDPKSLGVLSESTGHTLPSGVPADVAARATYAITVEPPGGSPNGKPSGAPVFFGHLIST